MKILITGATGFLGSHLTHYFLNKGHDLIILKRSFSNTHRLKGIIDRLKSYDLDKNGLDKAFADNPDIDCVLNTAALYARKNETVDQVVNANVVFPATVLEKAMQNSVPVFINTGTGLPKNLSLYSLTKVQFSEFGEFYASQGKIKFLNLQCEHFYGPGDDQSKFTSYVIESCLKNVDELKLTEGLQKRDFIYIDDTLEAFNTVLEKVNSIESNYEDIEIGSGKSIVVREFVEKVHKFTNSKTKLLFGVVPTRPNEPDENIANIDKIKKLGWKPLYSIDDGLLKTIKNTKVVEEIQT
jgi:CDP-paratose synthetase